MQQAAPRFADYERLLSPALRHTEKGTTMEDVREAIRSGRALFWPGEKSAAVTTEYHAHEFVLWLAGGDLEELYKMEAAAVDLARERGFSRAVVEDGRKGWGRVLKRLGYREVRQMVKDL
jgi:hypothetical protein